MANEARTAGQWPHPHHEIIDRCFSDTRIEKVLEMLIKHFPEVHDEINLGIQNFWGPGRIPGG